MSSKLNITEAKSSTKKQEIAAALTNVLADTFALYFKTHVFHWNVEGMHFAALHELFGTQYTDMWNATDDIAERIRTLDTYAPVNHTALLKHASITEDTGTKGDKAMVKVLAADHEKMICTLQKALEVSDKAADEATTDLLIQRLEFHEKTRWMLRSTAA